MSFSSLSLSGFQLLERLALDARDHSRDKPARLAHHQTDDILPRNSCLRLSSNIHIIRSLEGGSPFYGAWTMRVWSTS